MRRDKEREKERERGRERTMSERGEGTSRMFSSYQTSFANILNQDFILTERREKNFPNEQPLRMKERKKKKNRSFLIHCMNCKNLIVSKKGRKEFCTCKNIGL